MTLTRMVTERSRSTSTSATCTTPQEILIVNQIGSKLNENPSITSEMKIREDDICDQFYCYRGYFQNQTLFLISRLLRYF